MLQYAYTNLLDEKLIDVLYCIFYTYPESSA